MNAQSTPDPPQSPDPALSRTLRTWKVDATLPAGFAAEVHRRIARHTRTPGPTWIAGFLRRIAILQRPAFAVTYVAVGILLGAISGSRYSQASPEDSPGALQLRYIASIDPYQMPRAVTPPAVLP